LDHSEAIKNLIFTRNKRKKKAVEASEFLYEKEIITKHPQKLTTDNLNLIIFENYCLNEFEKMLKTLGHPQLFINQLKNFVSSHYEFVELLLSTMVSLQGHLHLLVTFLDFVNIFLNLSSLEIQKSIDEANIIKRNSLTLYGKFIQSDLNLGMQEKMNYQLFHLMIGAVLSYRDQVTINEKSLYDIEEKIQTLSKDCNREVFLSFQPPIEQNHPFPKIKKFVDLCWEVEDAKEVIQRYVYKYNPGSLQPDLIGLHLYKRPNYRLEFFNTWINNEVEKLRDIPEIYIELELYIEKDKQKIEDLKKSLLLLKNLKKVKLHLVHPFKAADKRIEEDQYDEFLSQTLEIISYFEYSLQLEIIFDFIYISPSGLELLGERICRLKELKRIEIEFSYCPHITDGSVKKVLANICSSLELESLVFKLFACQKVIYMESTKNDRDIPDMENRSKTKKIDFVCEPYSEHHSRAEVAGVVSQGFQIFI